MRKNKFFSSRQFSRFFFFLFEMKKENLCFTYLLLLFLSDLSENFTCVKYVLLFFFSLWKYRCSVTEIGWCSIIMSWGKNRSKEEFGNSEKNQGNWIWEIKQWNVARKSSCSSPKRENWENFKGRGSKMQIPRNERPPNVIKQKNCKPREKTQKKNPPKWKVNSILVNNGNLR